MFKLVLVEFLYLNVKIKLDKIMIKMVSFLMQFGENWIYIKRILKLDFCFLFDKKLIQSRLGIFI